MAAPAVAAPLFAPVPAAGHNSGDKEATFDAIADALATQGWCVLRDYFSPEILIALGTRLDHLRDEAALTPAGIGRGADNTEDEAIRRDITRWMERNSHDSEALLLNEMEELRQALNRRLMLGLFFYEAHFALYESGAFYKRHLDSFRGRRNRLISTVLYLNEDWKEEDGGLLALYTDENAPAPFARVLPERGTFVLFLSEDIPHEVQAAFRPRRSIAGWFRCNDKTEAPALQAPTVATPSV